MDTITPEQLMTTMGVLLALFAAIVTVDKVVDIFKKWREPATDTARKLDDDKRRLEEHESSIKALQESNKVLCSGILALLDHELHNGNTKQMEEARQGIMDYLAGKVAR